MQLFFSHLVKELEKGVSLSLATLVNTRGSTPQVPGASAIIGEQGLLYGTLGGGVMEGEILSKAIQSLKSHQNLIEEYNLDSNIAADAGPICGGYATILVDARPELSLDAFRALNDGLRSNQAGALVTYIHKDGERISLLKRVWISEIDAPAYHPTDKFPINADKLLEALNSKKPLLDESEIKDHMIFYQPVFPDPQLIIVGAGHIGKALSHIGKLLDFQVTIIDDRPDHANHENIPDADTILSSDIESDLKNLNIATNSYIVIVTQGHKKDGVALKQVIHSNAVYIGMIGSKRKTRLMKEEFMTNRWATKEELDTIYAPIGMDIHSKTVQEIAISIAGQLVKVRHEKNAHHRGKDIEIVILAAGKSERMGQQKLLMSYAGKTILENIVEKALDSNAGNVKVVVGSHRNKVCDLLKDHPVQIVENTDFDKGMLSSVQCGFNALSSTARAGMILLGDQPMVQTLVIDKLIDSFEKTGKGIIIPVYNTKKGHPVLIDTKYIPQINQLNPSIGLRQLMEECSEDIHELEVETNTILKDIDTIEDYKRELI
jgi:xanthine dehydrogenase accessory factor